MRKLAVFLLALSLTAAQPKVLVYTRNFVTTGEGYVHENIVTSVEAIRELGKQHGFEVESQPEPTIRANPGRHSISSYFRVARDTRNSPAGAIETPAVRKV
jgi:hypothetical protein